jgi:hypothetical protein
MSEIVIIMVRNLLVLTILVLLSGCLVPSKAGLSNVVIEIENPQEIGRTATGQIIRLGGFSGLWVVGRKGDQIHALAITDRGPNGEETGHKRPFFLPDFHPRIVRLDIDLSKRTVATEGEIILRRGQEYFSGLPFPSERGGPEMEVPVNLKGEKIATDREGIDPESLCVASDGTFWVGEEYGPDLLHFSSDGRLLRRYAPGAGLPEWLHARKVNGGFEGVACTAGSVYVVLQTPLRPNSSSQPRVPILQFDPGEERVVAEFSYPLESQENKIGDLFADDKGRFLIIEQNGRRGPSAFQKVFEIALAEPIQKREILNLVRAGFHAEKAEGLASFGDEILVISDNDFSLSKNSRQTQIGLFSVYR